MNGSNRIRLLAVLGAAVLAAALLGACGDSGSSTGSDQFRDQTKSPLLDFGKEGSESELEEADATVSAFLAARAKEDWGGTCAPLSKLLLEKLKRLATNSTSLEDTSCPSFLEAFVVLTPQDKEESAEIEGGSLRQQGAKGYLIYGGSEEVVNAMPLDREGDEWKLAALAPQPLS
jgi:hypothetical protein